MAPGSPAAARAAGQGSGTSASLRQRGARLRAQAEGLLLAGGSLKRGECLPAENYQHQDLRGRCQEREVLLGGEGLPDVIPPLVGRGIWGGVRGKGGCEGDGEDRQDLWLF